jgi:hypothetical protein
MVKAITVACSLFAMEGKVAPGSSGTLRDDRVRPRRSDSRRAIASVTHSAFRSGAGVSKRARCWCRYVC